MKAIIKFLKTVRAVLWSFLGIRKAARAGITHWSLADLGLDAPEPIVRRVALFAPAHDVPCEFISGDSPAAIAEKLAAKIGNAL